MFNISIYLNKFSNLELKDSVLKSTIIDSINEILGVNLDKKIIKVTSGGVICLKVDPVLRSEVFINKAKLIKQLKVKNINVKNIL